jgi:hypothetical protein
MLVRPFAGRLGLVLPALITAATAQDPRAAWAQFERDHRGPWLVEWNAATGTPRSILGQGLPLADWRENSLPEARRHADAALQRWPELLGLRDSEFRERIGARMGRTWTFQYDQWFRGLPVIGGRVDVRIHMTGRLCFLGSTAWPLANDFDVTPKVDEGTAEASAWLWLGREPNAVPQPGRAGANRLVLWGDAAAAAPAQPTLAWEVPVRAVDATGQGPIGRVYIDARTGAFVHYTNDKHECGLPGCGIAAAAAPAPVPTTYTVMAWAHTGFSPVSTPTNVPLANVELLVPGVGTVFTDQNGQFTVDLVAPTAVNVSLRGQHSNLVQGPNSLSAQVTLQPGVPSVLQLGSAAAGEQQLAHSTTYYWTDRINVWARGILGNSPELAVADNVTPTVNIASTCNAYYTGNTINFYASGGGCNNTAAASVVAHEWGHGLDDQYGGISQTNGLSEGWGDICSMYLLDDPVIGHDFFSGGGGIRNGNNGQQYPNGNGPHAQGQSWMGFAWQFRQILRSALGTQQALMISNDVVLASIAANASNQADAVIAAFLADDDDGILGNGTPHRAELIAACQAHSLPYPPLLPGYLEHTPLGLATTQLQPRRIEVNAVPLSGSYTQVRVHWNDGQARQRDLVPTGVGTTWHGLLPGMLAPQVLQYHIEAQHSSGVVDRLPTSGEYGYATIAERRIWSEDFEGNVAGWTHGAISGVDDWEIGAPQGRAGANWSDPSAAASGTNCAGTDLSGNGAYEPNSVTWLRSPPIDCTGVSGLRLRFKRWISCAGPTDRIELRVQGALVWTSSFVPVADSGWSTFDTMIPGANNQPAAVIEFRLYSDAFSEVGGWNIDDVEIYSLGYAVPLPASLTMLPEQAAANTTMTLQVTTNGPQPFFLVLGDTAGPTPLPSLPTLLVGGNLIALAGGTAGNGLYTTTFVAPPAPVGGSIYHSQLLTIDGTAVVRSNPFLNLFTQ